jgi:excisionase family DNA binding protein
VTTTKIEIPLNEKLLLTISESEARSNRGRSTLLKAIADGELDAVKHGRSTLIRPDALQRWIDSFPPYTPCQLAANTRPRRARAQAAAAPAPATASKRAAAADRKAAVADRANQRRAQAAE